MSNYLTTCFLYVILVRISLKSVDTVVNVLCELLFSHHSYNKRDSYIYLHWL